MRRYKWTAICLIAAALVATGATACFFIQGGFGGGHGALDRTLFILALPWSAIPWPEFLTSIDYLWLILLPFILNVLSIAVITSAVNHSRRAVTTRRIT